MFENFEECPVTEKLRKVFIWTKNAKKWNQEQIVEDLRVHMAQRMTLITEREPHNTVSASCAALFAFNVFAAAASALLLL